MALNKFKLLPDSEKENVISNFYKYHTCFKLVCEDENKPCSDCSEFTAWLKRSK